MDALGMDAVVGEEHAEVALGEEELEVSAGLVAGAGIADLAACEVIVVNDVLRGLFLGAHQVLPDTLADVDLGSGAELLAGEVDLVVLGHGVGHGDESGFVVDGGHLHLVADDNGHASFSHEDLHLHLDACCFLDAESAVEDGVEQGRGGAEEGVVHANTKPDVVCRHFAHHIDELSLRGVLGEGDEEERGDDRPFLGSDSHVLQFGGQVDLDEGAEGVTLDEDALERAVGERHRALGVQQLGRGAEFLAEGVVLEVAGGENANANDNANENENDMSEVCGHVRRVRVVRRCSGGSCRSCEPAIGCRR